MSQLERYFDRLMNDYYLVLINTWDEQIKASARYAISELAKLDQNQRADEVFLKSLEYIIRRKLGEEFAIKLDEPVKQFCEMSYKLSSEEKQFAGLKISFSPTDQRNIDMVKRQQVFWLKSHYDSAVSKRMQAVLDHAFEDNLSNQELADDLQKEFKEIMKGSRSYFEGLAEHTGLRIREFGRLKNYEKVGAQYYKIVAVMDERTSDICRALNGKIFPLEPALNAMNAMFEVNEHQSFEEAKEELKRIAPFVRDNQVEYDSSGKPTGIHGMHTPFPPFHWRCRTRTVLV